MEENSLQSVSEQNIPQTDQPLVDSVSPETPPVTQEKGSQSRKILIYGLPAIALIALGALGLWFYQEKMTKKPTPPTMPVIPTATQTPIIPSPTPTPESTIPAGWKTYRNEEYGFELKYPPDWELADRLSDPNFPTLELLKNSPTQTSSFEFLDGASLKFFPSRRQPDEEILSTLESYGDPKPFVYLEWSGFRSRGQIEDGIKTDAISGTKEVSSGKTIQFFWLHFNPISNGLEAEKYLFPILSAFKFLD